MEKCPVQQTKDKVEINLTIDTIVDRLNIEGSHVLANVIKYYRPLTAYVTDSCGNGYIGIDLTKKMPSNIEQYKKEGSKLMKYLINVEGYRC